MTTLMQPAQSCPLISCTVDVEDYFHATNMDVVIGRRRWLSQAARIEFSIQLTLDLFDAVSLKGTFFVLGWVARRFPKIVKQIQTRGHEIASHGYMHRLAYHQSARQFYRDVLVTKLLLEDIAGEAVHGYRAPNFSIQKQNFYAYDALIEAGYCYDSSLNPIRHPRYGNINRSCLPQRMINSSGELLVLPLAVLNVGNMRLPIAGGAYWRFTPLKTLKVLVKRRLQNDPSPAIFYFHPWEFDAAQPRISSLSLISQLRHYYGINSLHWKLKAIFKNAASRPLIQLINAGHFKASQTHSTDEVI